MKKKPLKNKINKVNLNDTITPLKDNLEKKLDRGLTNQPYSELNNFIQYSIGDDIQAFMDTDEQGNVTFKNGIVKYNYKNGKALKSRPTAEIVILDAFNNNEAQEISERVADAKELENDIEKELASIYKPISQIKEIEEQDKTTKPTSFRILLKKVELFFVEQLYNNRNISVNPTIEIRDTELARIFNMDRANLNREMNKILIALSQIQIRSFKWSKPMYSKRNGTKEEIPNLALVNLIQDAVHRNGITQITFNDKFTRYISLCNVLQAPKELYQVKDALTFDLILYLYGQVREKKTNKFKIKMQTIYDTIKQIPRYENVKGRNYAREIYQPIEKAFETLGKGKGNFNIANINYENTDFIKANNTYDFNKWLNTNLVIEIIKEPSLQTLRDARQKYKRLAEKNK